MMSLVFRFLNCPQLINEMRVKRFEIVASLVELYEMLLQKKFTTRCNAMPGELIDILFLNLFTMKDQSAYIMTCPK